MLDFPLSPPGVPQGSELPAGEFYETNKEGPALCILASGNGLSFAFPGETTYDDRTNMLTRLDALPAPGVTLLIATTLSARDPEHGMKTHNGRMPAAVRRLFVLGLVSALSAACCPTGAFEDNFGSLYSLVTLPTDDFNAPFLTTGAVDTRDMGCGVWSVRPPEPGEPAVDPDNPVAWVAVNPDPNPTDHCCYAFRFDGQITGSGCILILGEYRSVGGKCQQSGQMFLQAVR